MRIITSAAPIQTMVRASISSNLRTAVVGHHQPSSLSLRERLESARSSRYQTSAGCVNLVNMREILLVFAFVLVSGCVPWPHNQSLGPRLSGILRDGEAPKAGIEIVYQVHSGRDEFDCSAPQSRADTDTDGRFNLEKPTEFQWFVPLVGDPVMSWSVCAKLDDSLTLLWLAPGQGGWNYPGQFELDCNASRQLSRKSNSSEIARCSIEYCDAVRCVQVFEFES